MSKKDDVQLEAERLEEEGVTLDWLHKESQRIALKVMQQYPNTWKKEIAKMYTYTAVCELIETKRKER